MYIHAVKVYEFGNIRNKKEKISRYTALCCNKSEIFIDVTGITHFQFASVPSLI